MVDNGEMFDPVTGMTDCMEAARHVGFLFS